MASRDFRKWTIDDSAELFGINAWGADYFGISPKGNVVVKTPGGTHAVELSTLVSDLAQDNYPTPLVLRFPDVLRHRVASLCGSFQHAIGEYAYEGEYRGVYPIKVNQQRHVVEDLVRYGWDEGLGLEVGSKPELLIALTLLDNPKAMLVCNGYKDIEYIETALLSQRLGRNTLIVVDRFTELQLIVETSKRLGIRPRIGVRAKLAARGAGKWAESGGSASKFGLSADELVATVDYLREQDLLPCLEMLHFHIGSQITAIRAIKDALKESSRIFVELCQLGAQLTYLDVGGGLGVDYDGSQTNFHSSTNYTMQEYANDVVWAIKQACDDKKIPHPHIISESGRALVAHHSVLIFNVLGSNRNRTATEPTPATEDDPAIVRELWDIYEGITPKTLQESFHDAVGAKDEINSLFKLGYLDLKTRARAERLFWSCAARIHDFTKDLDRLPEDLELLRRGMTESYFCNFSVFQSAPDHWAVKQLFPTLPIQRLDEEPKQRAILADLTCDSDGKVDQFIDLRGTRDSLEVHDLRPDEPYYIAMFLVGAYQETLGDLHNLFGDTHVMHISLEEGHVDKDGKSRGYRVDHALQGDSIANVLSYVQYNRSAMLDKLQQDAKAAVSSGQLTHQESALLLERFGQAMAGYTYLHP